MERNILHELIFHYHPNQEQKQSPAGTYIWAWVCFNDFWPNFRLPEDVGCRHHYLIPLEPTTAGRLLSKGRGVLPDGKILLGPFGYPVFVKAGRIGRFGLVAAGLASASSASSPAHYGGYLVPTAAGITKPYETVTNMNSFTHDPKYAVDLHKQGHNLFEPDEYKEIIERHMADRNAIMEHRGYQDRVGMLKQHYEPQKFEKLHSLLRGKTIEELKPFLPHAFDMYTSFDSFIKQNPLFFQQNGHLPFDPKNNILTYNNIAVSGSDMQQNKEALATALLVLGRGVGQKTLLNTKRPVFISIFADKEPLTGYDLAHKPDKDGGTITIVIGGKASKYQNNALIHELGHAVDFLLPLESQKHLQELYTSERQMISNLPVKVDPDQVYELQKRGKSESLKGILTTQMKAAVYSSLTPMEWLSTLTEAWYSAGMRVPIRHLASGRYATNVQDLLVHDNGQVLRFLKKILPYRFDYDVNNMKKLSDAITIKEQK